MRIDKLGLKGKRNFQKNVNNNCETGLSGSSCIIKVFGEVSLNREFRIVVWAQKLAFMEKDLRTVIETYE